MLSTWQVGMNCLTVEYGVEMDVDRSNLSPSEGLLRRGVYPEPVEGLLAMTETDEFSDTRLAKKMWLSDRRKFQADSSTCKAG